MATSKTTSDLPSGTKIAVRNRKRSESKSFFDNDYRLVCKVCGAVMEDIEPVARGGEHRHPEMARNPKTGEREFSQCPHAGEGVFHPYEYPKDRRGSRWVEVFRPKKYRRARAQARKAVSKK